MELQMIEKAANDFISDFCYDHIDSSAINHEEDNYEAGRNHALLDYGNDIFIAGAQWRINSVWHDMKKEVPQVYGEYENEVAPSIPCLVRGYLSTGYGYGVRYWNVSYEVWDDEECDDYECDKDKIEEWAYLDDLIPERKEETK